MESKESKSKVETTAADRRAFMKTVVAGTVAVGLASTVGKAEAATLADACGNPLELPKIPMKVKLVLNKNLPPTTDDLHKAIDEIFSPSGCPRCGMIGIPERPDIIRQLSFEMAYLSKDLGSMVVIQDVAANPAL